MEARSNKLQAKDLINVGVFTAIYFIVFFAGMMLGYGPSYNAHAGYVLFYDFWKCGSHE